MWVQIKSPKSLKGVEIGHQKCLHNYNSTVSCGLRHAECHDPYCCFSLCYDEEAAYADHRRRVAEKGETCACPICAPRASSVGVPKPILS